MSDPTSDAELAERISIQWLNRYGWNGAWGWLRHNLQAGVWEDMPDDVIIDSIQRELVQVALSWESGIPDPSGFSPRPQQVRPLRSTSKAQAVERVLRGRLLEDPRRFDSNPDLLNTPSSVVDLRTGQVRDHSPSDRFMLSTAVPFDPSASSELWSTVLEALPQETRDWMQLRMGQALTGHPVPDDRMLLQQGDGENGKSALFDGILGTVGSYGKVLPHRLLLGNPGDHPTEYMTLKGLRLGLIEELPEGRYLDMQRIKATVGTSRINARLVRKDNVEFDATHSLFVTTNYIPVVSEMDHGSWRRLLMVPWPYKYVDIILDDSRERLRIEGLKEGMKLGDPAILSWLVAGAVKAHRDPAAFRKVPEAVQRATANFKQENDLIAQFAEDKLDFSDPSAFTPTDDIVRAFNDWLMDRGHKRVAHKTVLTRWAASDITSMLRPSKRLDGGSQRRGFIGISLDYSSEYHR